MDQLSAWSRRLKCNPLWRWGGRDATVMATKSQSLETSGNGEITSSLGGWWSTAFTASTERESERGSVQVNKNYKMFENAHPLQLETINK